MKKFVGQEVTVKLRRHWSEFVVDYLDACEVPGYLKQYDTPEQAWKNANAEHIEWLLDSARVDYGSTFDSDDFRAADQYRRKNPIPPKLRKMVDRFVKQPITINELQDDVMEHKYSRDGGSMVVVTRKPRKRGARRK